MLPQEDNYLFRFRLFPIFNIGSLAARSMNGLWLNSPQLLGITIRLKWGEPSVLTGHFCFKTNTYRRFVYACKNGRENLQNEDEILLSLNVPLGQQLIRNHHLTITFTREAQWGSKQLQGGEKQSKHSLMVCHLLPITYCHLLQIYLTTFRTEETSSYSEECLNATNGLG